MCDNLPVRTSAPSTSHRDLTIQLSLLRALPTTTPVILCPAMNTHMYSHPFTAEHLLSLEEKLGYLISGPQGAGKLACGDEGQYQFYPVGV
jgi:phosphopantothenoylcysteine synthetase/decarboxylase